MVATSYTAYTSIVYMVIELIRQFYDEPRKFRIANQQGDPNYVTYTNAGLKQQQLPPSTPNEGMTTDPATGQMMQDPNYQPKFRNPMFDIKVKPEKASPFVREAQNEMAKELFNLGFFNPQRAFEAKIALELMSFEGKEKVAKLIAQNGDMFVVMQNMQKTLEQQQQLMMGMNAIVMKTTGKDVMGMGQMPPAQGQNGGMVNGQG
jgi:hypothetical protein